MTKKLIRITPKAARVNARITQNKAANLLGVDVSTLRRYENGETMPPLDIANKMSELYELELDYIFFAQQTAKSD